MAGGCAVVGCCGDIACTRHKEKKGQRLPDAEPKEAGLRAAPRCSRRSCVGAVRAAKAEGRGGEASERHARCSGRREQSIGLQGRARWRRDAVGDGARAGIWWYLAAALHLAHACAGMVRGQGRRGGAGGAD
jgi:hypothetical protein